jgi:hypothetical protein
MLKGTSMLAVPVAIAMFTVFGAHAANCLREKKYRGFCGGTALGATVLGALIIYYWMTNEGASMGTRIVILSVVGAIAGATFFNWVGYTLSDRANAQIGPPSNVAPQPPGNNTSSTNQQGGITAGSVGTINVNPSPSARPDNRTAIATVVQIIEQGEQINRTFEQTNNVELVTQQYQQWSAKAEAALTQQLDKSYAIQFRNAPGVIYGRVGMASAGMGIWQHISGRINVLNGFITELRRASN